MCLRSAGFPIHSLDPIAAEASAAAVDAYLDRDEAWQRVRDAALAECYQIARTARREAGMELPRAIRLLGKDRLPEALPRGTDSRLLAALSDAHGARDQAQLAARERVAEAIERTSEVLRDVARDFRFREALIWQNRRALKTALDPLLRAAQARNSSTRQKEALVASYIQRYAAKNETIGFSLAPSAGPNGHVRAHPLRSHREAA